MGGVETIAGITYQQAYTLHLALDVLEDEIAEALRVEGSEEVVDAEVLSTGERVLHAVQVKTRRSPRTWSQKQILDILERWSGTKQSEHGTFAFVTNGALGPSAQALRRALDLARSGREEALLPLLGQNPAPEMAATLRRCTISVRNESVAELVESATQRTATLLSGQHGAAEASHSARHHINELFRALFISGSDPRAERRTFTRAELGGILGVDASRKSPKFRWASAKKRYTSQTASQTIKDPKTGTPLPENFCPTLVPMTGMGSESALARVEQLWECAPAATLYGRTGSGKSTAISFLQREAGANGRSVIVLHAQAYEPGRLVQQLTSELSRVLGELVPRYTATEALADPGTMLVIDGVSEVAESYRTSIGNELRDNVFFKRGIRVVLVGRDVATLRSVVPTSLAIDDFSVKPMDYSSRRQAAAALVEARGDPPGTSIGLASRAEEALGDAAGNPLLFTMALSLIAAGRSAENAAVLYEGFVELLAHRSGTSDIIRVTVGLGYIFAKLIDSGRRHADPLDWDILSAEVENLDVGLSARSLSEAAHRCGLITRIGSTQLVAAIHDSFADYLAALACVRLKLDLPTALRKVDVERVEFIAQMAGVDRRLALATARHIPFTAARIAHFDRRTHDQGSTDELQTLLSLLFPAEASNRLSICLLGDGRVVAGLNQTGAFKAVPESKVDWLLRSASPVVVSKGGPLKVATELWLRKLEMELRPDEHRFQSYPSSSNEAQAMVEAHARETEQHVRTLVARLFSTSAANAILGELGNLGISATISDCLSGDSDWDLSYRQAQETKVRIGVVDQDWGATRTGVRNFLDSSPEAAAMAQVRQALSQLAGTFGHR